jgi:Fe-Mn family superoxide dismutase
MHAPGFGEQSVRSVDEQTMNRRGAIATLAAVGAGLVAGCGSVSPRPVVPTNQGETPMTQPRALAGIHTPVPLPFKAGSLNGLSERLITSHHENNYGGAVKNLNRAEQELSRITAETAPFVVAALRERELMFRNSKQLHEAYFANLGGDGRRSGAIDAALGEAYGSTANWETQFRASAMGLGGGSGWVVLALELDTGALRIIGSGNHTQAVATGMPLLVLDMYEHSYHLDFGAGHARYIDAFFANVSWDEVNRRYERAQKAVRALAGAT